MFSPDLVRARRRDGQLHLMALGPKTRATAIPIAERYLALARAHVGRTRGDLAQAYRAVPLPASHRKLGLALQRLIERRCTFQEQDAVDPVALRRALFTEASRQRREGSLDPGLAVRRAVTHLCQHPDEQKQIAEHWRRWLFADLPDAQVILGTPSFTADLLLKHYEVAHVQAVLLRATRVNLTLRDPEPTALRQLFRTIKFRRLLFEAVQTDRELGITLDGPMSLFRASTKYGTALALTYPWMTTCGPWALQADLLWGKDRESLRFSCDGHGPALTEENEPLGHDPVPSSPEVQSIVDRWGQRGGFRVRPCQELMVLPRQQVLVPDLKFEKPGGKVLLEQLGHWSRDAVFKRAELAVHLTTPMLFLVPARLRVSEAILPSGERANLLVHKGVVPLKRLEECITRLATA